MGELTVVVRILSIAEHIMYVITLPHPIPPGALTESRLDERPGQR